MYRGIAIDEISMNPGKQVDKLVFGVLQHNKILKESKKLKANHNELSLTFLGDIAQLGPPKEEHDPFFKAASWKYVDVTYLSEVKRQTNPEFINIVSQLRVGKVKNVVDWFESKIGFQKKLDMEFAGSTCFPTNKQVDDFNAYKLSQLNTTEKRYYSEVSGAPNRDWKSIPECVVVKPGMKVMLLANNFDEMYANGDLGIVEECFPASILVRLLRDERKVLIEYKSLSNTIISQNKEGEYVNKRIGTINYLPIRQGDSHTVHKCVDGNTLISTPKGLIPLKNINRNDLVFTSDGTPQRVLAHVHSGKKPKVDVLTQEGYRINVSDTHPILVRTREGQEEFKSIKDITSEDFLCIARPQNECQKINNLGWLLGALVGEGYYNNDVDYAVVKNKSIPKFVLESEDLSIPAGFLQGIFDTDGCVRVKSKNIVLTSCSSKLIEQTQQLLLRFGIISCIHLLREETENEDPLFQLTISGSKNIELFKENISLSESTKLKKLQTIARTVEGKTNKDFIPMSKKDIEKIKIDLLGKPKSSRLRSFLNGGIQNFSYIHLKEIIDLYDNKVPGYLQNLLVNHYYYSKIKEIKINKIMK
jgi:hypothetical protein